jgi:hypothetical protein
MRLSPQLNRLAVFLRELQTRTDTWLLTNNHECLQYWVYLAQNAGINLNYHFCWHYEGRPEASELHSDLLDLGFTGKDRVAKAIRDYTVSATTTSLLIKLISTVNKVLQGPSSPAAKPRLLRLLAATAYLMRDNKKPSAIEIRDLLRRFNQVYPIDDIETAMDAVKSLRQEDHTEDHTEDHKEEHKAEEKKMPDRIMVVPFNRFADVDEDKDASYVFRLIEDSYTLLDAQTIDMLNESTDAERPRMLRLRLEGCAGTGIPPTYIQLDYWNTKESAIDLLTGAAMTAYARAYPDGPALHKLQVAIKYFSVVKGGDEPILSIKWDLTDSAKEELRAHVQELEQRTELEEAWARIKEVFTKEEAWRMFVLTNSPACRHQKGRLVSLLNRKAYNDLSTHEKAEEILRYLFHKSTTLHGAKK